MREKQNQSLSCLLTTFYSLLSFRVDREKMEMKIKAKTFEDLEVWKKAHELVLEAYKVTRYFPNEEKFSLVSQMRRAAVSIAANIAEGFRKRTLKDKANFYNMSQGSLEELRYYLILSTDLGYLKDNKTLNSQCEQTGRMLYGLIKSIQEKDSRQ